MSTKKAYVNIKNLPETLQISDGDYLIVERLDGTYILDYTNLILEPEKTQIKTLVDAQQTDIEELSASMDTRYIELSTLMEANVSNTYVGMATVTVDSGYNKSAVLTPRPTAEVPEITPTDFIITPANAVACRFGGYISEVDDSTDNRGFFTIAAGFYRTSMNANTATGEVSVNTVESTAEELGAQPTYNVLVYKTY
jgi:hypothetical protein